jgi:hypothetical protein
MFNLKTASRGIQDCAAAVGIKTGSWEPVNSGTAIDALPDDAVVANVWNKRKNVQITAGDVRYANEYL